MHHDQYACIRRDPRIWGSYVWMMFDTASDNRDEGDHKGINDKGLVAHDHRKTKDAYHFYRANWRDEHVLHLCSKRMAEVGETFTVVGFSNRGAVTLTVNGRTVGTQDPDEVRTVRWTNVHFDEGVNVIELCAGDLVDRCTWLRRGPKDDVKAIVEKVNM